MKYLELWLYINGFRIFVSGLCYFVYIILNSKVARVGPNENPYGPSTNLDPGFGFLASSYNVNTTTCPVVLRH
jgi:hypothetical protein